LDLQAIHDYLALRYAPGPGGMLQGLRKLPAGHFALVTADRVAISKYWQPLLYEGTFSGTEPEYVDRFAELFEQSVRRQMVSEVPVGAYLSGGVDSSAIVAAMSRVGSGPVRTFTVGFDYDHDELADAAETAKRLGCEHTEVSCRVSDVNLLPDIVYHLDEPIGDPIVIPMFQLSREAKKQVTVILAGEGADETLGGYLFVAKSSTGSCPSRFYVWLRPRGSRGGDTGETDRLGLRLPGRFGHPGQAKTGGSGCSAEARQAAGSVPSYDLVV
jgi:asparagine synthase (glutamine-hydrolysing)